MKKLILKRLFGLNLISLILILSLSNNPNNVVTSTVCFTEYDIDGSSIASIYNSSNENKESESTNIIPKKADDEKKLSHADFLAERYSNIVMYKKSDFIQEFIDEHKDFIKERAGAHGLNGKTILAAMIIENINAQKERYGVLARKYHNWGNIKVKSGSFYSSEFQDYLNKYSTNIVRHRDDCEKTEDNPDGKCEFYTFKNDNRGMEAMIKFIADRIKSDHPNWKDEFNNVNPNDIENFAFHLWKVGYAAKNSTPTYDQKIIRIIRTYDM